MPRYILYLLLGHFCFFNFSYAQNELHDEHLIQIQNLMAAGYLNEADQMAIALVETQNNPQSYWHKRAILLRAEIAGLYGKTPTMFEHLNTLDQHDSHPVIRYYWHAQFSRYCFLNQQWALGTDYLSASLDQAAELDFGRTWFNARFDELYLIYYTQGVEEAVENGEMIPPIVDDLFLQLEDNTTKMLPFEKQRYLMYLTYFTSFKDTTRHTELAHELLEFSDRHNSPVAKIRAYHSLAYFIDQESDSTLVLHYLNEAESESKKINVLRYKLETKYALMHFYKKRQHYERAIYWGKKAVFPEETDLSTYFDTYGQLSELYEANGQPDSALYYKKIDSKKYRSISQGYANNMQAFFIEQLSENLKEKERQLTRNIVFTVILCVTIVIILVLLFKLIQKNQSLAHSNVKLTQNNQAIEHFSHLLSHDLKAPIHSINNLAGYILEDEKNLSEESKEYLNLIRQTSHNSSLLILNIMTYIRDQHFSIPFEQVSLPQLLKTAQENLDEMIREAHAIIQLETLPPFIYGNATLLTQVFQNLIQNALKYRKETVQPEIVIRFHEDGQERIISVEDNGMGIRPEKLKTVLESFSQEKFDSVSNGVGLGLSICNHVMREHEGRIYIESEYGKWTRINLCFPANRFDNKAKKATNKG